MVLQQECTENKNTVEPKRHVEANEVNYEIAKQCDKLSSTEVCNCKVIRKTCGCIDENESPSNGSQTNKTASPLNKIVRQTSTPMAIMLSDLKRYSYESMSASSIQVSSIGSSSIGTDVSQELPAMKNVNILKQSNNRMQMAFTPYQQIMSKSIQRAINNPKQSYGRYVDSAIATPPLDLRTSPVIRRTNFIEPNSYRTSINSHRIQSIQISEDNKLNDQNIQNLKQEALQKSFLSSNKAVNTFYETCRRFTGANSNHTNATPTTSGTRRRIPSFAARNNFEMYEEESEQWFTPDVASKTSVRKPQRLPLPKSPIDPKIMINENDLEDEKNNSSPNKLAKTNNGLWSFLSSVFRLTSSGGTTENTDPNYDPNDNPTHNSMGSTLIKRCASFTGILRKKMPIHSPNSFKRRRTATLSEVDNYYKVLNDESIPIRRVQRIQGRRPIDRMRQS